MCPDLSALSCREGIHSNISMTIRGLFGRVMRWTAALLVVLFILGASLLGFFMAEAGKRESVSRTDAAPMNGFFVRAADVEIYVQEWRPKTGRPVLFVHAAGGWSGVWEKTGKELSAAGYRAIDV